MPSAQRTGTGALPSAVDSVLLAVGLTIAAGYLALGVGHVMDDWYTLHHAHFDGPWMAAGPDQWGARPVAAAVYGLVFGVLDGAIVPVLLAMAVANAVSAMFLARLARMFAPASVAFGAAVAWLVLPTTTSIEAWLSAANISLALVAALGALWVAASRPPTTRWLVVAAVLSAGSVLSYEAVLMALGVGAIALVVKDRARYLVPAAVLAGAAAVGFGWMVLHWHPNKRVTSAWGDVGQVIPANLTWGVAQGFLGPLVGLVVLIVSAATFTTLLDHHRLRSARVPMAMGWLLLGAGVVPYLKYTYAPVGAGDRANVVSSLGGAILLATTTWVLAGLTSRHIGIAVAVIGLAVSLQPRVLMMRSWSLAGEDAAAIEAAVRALEPGQERVVLGPSRVDRNGVTAMQHPDILEDAVQLLLDDQEVRATITTSVEEFEAAEGAKLDVRELIDDPEAPGDR